MEHGGPERKYYILTGTCSQKMSGVRYNDRSANANERLGKEAVSIVYNRYRQ